MMELLTTVPTRVQADLVFARLRRAGIAPVTAPTRSGPDDVDGETQAVYVEDRELARAREVLDAARRTRLAR